MLKNRPKNRCLCVLQRVSKRRRKIGGEVARRLPAARRGFPGRGAPAVRELPRRSRGEGGEERGGAVGGLRLPRGGGAAGVLSGRNQEKHDESGLRFRI